MGLLLIPFPFISWNSPITGNPATSTICYPRVEFVQEVELLPLTCSLSFPHSSRLAVNSGLKISIKMDRSHPYFSLAFSPGFFDSGVALVSNPFSADSKGSPNYSLRAKSCPLLVFVNKVYQNIANLICLSFVCGGF